MTRPWHALTAQDAWIELGEPARDPAHGLSSAQHLARLERHGGNRLETHSGPPWYRVLARQFRDVLIAILAVAAGVSFALGEVLDGAAVLVILLLNGLLGFVQEWRAEQALAALQDLLTPRCTAVRDGREQVVDAVTLVPGDVVQLAGGDRVPADVRILSEVELRVDESSLTGESDSVSKGVEPVVVDRALAERKSMAWMGTVVTSGRARALVVATGMETELGVIARLTRGIRREHTPLQRRLHQLGKQLGAFALGAAALVTVTGMLLGRPMPEMFMTGVSLAVAVVPEGLPAVLTVTLALGVRQMVKRRALPRRLQATETLGAVTVVLTDKTGTLTENEMTVSHVWLPAGAIDVTGNGYAPEGGFEAGGEPLEPEQRADLQALLRAGELCNHAGIEYRDGSWSRTGEPTEAALVVLARKARRAKPEGNGVPELAFEFPFDSTRKRMTVVVEHGTRQLACSKGAPEVLLERCTHLLEGHEERPLEQADREGVREAGERLARAGMRVLALAQRTLEPGVPPEADAVERELTLLGLVGIHDPPRQEVPAAIARARSAGIRVVLVTGDGPATALAIAARVGLNVNDALSGPALDRMNDAELLDALQRPLVFARTTPEHKLRLAGLMRGAGHVVAMTGDGVNDAPALRAADVGIAMGLRGTEVAREAADLVLLDDNFASIVDAIEEGRREYDNVLKFVRYLLSSNAGEAVAIFLGILLRLPLLLLPVQILWINVVTDALTALALGLEPPEAGLMRRPPRAPRAPILDRAAGLSILLFGGYIGLATLGLFRFYLGPTPGELIRAQTVAFTGMVVLEQVNLFNHRALRSPLRAIGLWSNPWLLAALAVTVLLQFAAVYAPPLQAALHTTGLAWSEWVLIVWVALPLFAVPEALKWVRWKRASDPLADVPRAARACLPSNPPA